MSEITFKSALATNMSISALSRVRDELARGLLDKHTQTGMETAA
jgi:hypothetical protein